MNNIKKFLREYSALAKKAAYAETSLVAQFHEEVDFVSFSDQMHVVHLQLCDAIEEALCCWGVEHSALYRAAAECIAFANKNGVGEVAENIFSLYIYGLNDNIDIRVEFDPSDMDISTKMEGTKTTFMDWWEGEAAGYCGPSFSELDPSSWRDEEFEACAASNSCVVVYREDGSYHTILVSATMYKADEIEIDTLTQVDEGVYVRY